MDRGLVIRGTTLGGYGLPGLLGLIAVVAVVNAFLTQIWARPGALILWLIVIGGGVVATLFVEAVNRRNIVEVNGDRIRWSFRQPPEKGDEPLSALRSVEVFPSGARLVFEGGQVFVGRAMFTPRAIRRLVDGLRGSGAQVRQMGGAA